MIFQLDLRIPANTTSVAGFERNLPLLPGLVERVWIGFPEGCYGLAGVQLWRAESQILPLTAGRMVAWNNHVYEFPLHYRVYDEPLRFRVRGWNRDDSYSHTITIVVSVAPLEMGYPEYGFETTLEDVYESLGIE